MVLGPANIIISISNFEWTLFCLFNLSSNNYYYRYTAHIEISGRCKPSINSIFYNIIIICIICLGVCMCAIH